jgi:hypothetical protein
MQAKFSTAVKEAGRSRPRTPTPFPTDDFSTFLLKVSSHNPRPQVLGAMQADADLVNLVKQYNQFRLRDKSIRLAIGLMFDSDIKAIGPGTAGDAVHHRVVLEPRRPGTHLSRCVQGPHRAAPELRPGGQLLGGHPVP